MLFQSRVLHVAKDLGYADEYEDAYCVCDERGTAAVADGVSSAVFSGQWSRIVTESLAHRPPDLHDSDAFRRWLKDVRSVWSSQIDFPRLPPNLQAKLRNVGGAFCTLLWLGLRPADDLAGGRFRLSAFALGDSSLFHVRDGALLTSFPMTCAAEFEADPMSLCSVDWNRDQNLEFRSLETDCETGDLLVLATDAVAKWILTTLAVGGVIDWNSYWSVDDAAWVADIESLRAEHRIRRDDSTMILLSVGQPSPHVLARELDVEVAARDEALGTFAPDGRGCIEEPSTETAVEISLPEGAVNDGTSSATVTGRSDPNSVEPSAIPDTSLDERATDIEGFAPSNKTAHDPGQIDTAG